MSTILLLFVLGILLLVLDLFLPGIILSLLGTLAMLAGTARAFSIYGVTGGLLAFFSGVLLLAVALYVEYGILPKTRFGRRFFLDAAVDGTSQGASNSPVLVGKEGIAITTLMPTGQIEVGGRRYEAQSLDGHIEKGARVRVAGFQNFSYTVNKLS
jgi:membrane-bound ClpP family serine protease